MYIEGEPVLQMVDDATPFCDAKFVFCYQMRPQGKAYSYISKIAYTVVPSTQFLIMIHDSEMILKRSARFMFLSGKIMNTPLLFMQYMGKTSRINKKNFLKAQNVAHRAQRKNSYQTQPLMPAMTRLDHSVLHLPLQYQV